MSLHVCMNLLDGWGLLSISICAHILTFGVSGGWECGFQGVTIALMVWVVI